MSLQRRERLLQAQLAAEQRDAELTFAPAINVRSARLAARPGARPALGARPQPRPSGEIGPCQRQFLLNLRPVPHSHADDCAETDATMRQVFFSILIPTESCWTSQVICLAVHDPRRGSLTWPCLEGRTCCSQ